jgi:transcription initiation factor TFIID subunit TAF12
MLAQELEAAAVTHYQQDCVCRTLVQLHVHMAAVSFEDLMKSSEKQQQQGAQQEQPDAQQQQQQKQQQQQQQQVSPGALVGSFKGSASQTRPIPPHVLDQEYDMVHQVGGWLAGLMYRL